MSENFSNYRRPEPKVVGPASQEKKDKYRQMILERFGESHYEQIPADKRKILEALEYEKKSYEKEAIKISNEVTNILLEELGFQPFNVPERNIHIIPESLYKKIESDTEKVGITFQDKQLIILNAEALKHPFDRVLAILHEIVHLKNYLAIEAYEDTYNLYRRGWQIIPFRKKSEKIGLFVVFNGLNEAIVSEITKRYFPQLICGNKFLKDEYQWETSKEAQKLKEKISNANKIEVDEIVWVSKEGDECNFFPYYEQRKVLNYLVDVLYEDNTDQFASREEVMKLFFKVHFNGKLLSVARLIRKSFGDDAFRIIGMMDDGKNSPKLVKDYLIKHRKRVKK